MAVMELQDATFDQELAQIDELTVVEGEPPASEEDAPLFDFQGEPPSSDEGEEVVAEDVEGAEGAADEGAPEG